MGQRLHVKYDAAKLSTATIADAVADTGMRAWLETRNRSCGSERQARARQALVWASGGTLGLGLALSFRMCRPLGLRLLRVSLAAGVAATIRKAWSALRIGSLDINVLMIIAALGAAVIGEMVGSGDRRVPLRRGAGARSPHARNGRAAPSAR